MSLVLENVEEGFLMLDRNAKLGSERSRILDTWFGTPLPDASLGSYLAAVNPQLADRFGIGWDAVIEAFLPLELTIFQLPASFEHNRKSYAIRYRPILEGEELISGFVTHVNDARNYLTRLILHERENLEEKAVAQHRPPEAVWSEEIGR